MLTEPSTAGLEQIKQFAVLPVFWEPGGDKITPTMKLKRQMVAVKYADVIESLYAGAGGPAQPSGPVGWKPADHPRAR